MSHIVIDARESGTSTGRYIDKLVEFLHALHPKHHITIVTKPSRVTYMQQIAPDFDVVETNVKEFTFAEQTTFKKELEALNPDLIHFPIVQQPVLYGGRVVTTMQDLTTTRFNNPAKNAVVFWVKQQIYKVVNKWVARKSWEIITPTEFVKHDIAQYCHVPLEKITVTLEAADIMPPGSAPYTPVLGKPFIMYIGRPTPHKNLARLIEAHQKLRQKHPDLLLVLAGKKDANYQLHEKTVLEKGYENVIFTDFIPDDQFRWLLEHCEAYCFPSLSEGFGLPGLEAMLHGAPVVSSNATCLPEVYGNAAHYFNPYNVQDIAQAIDDVISSPQLRDELIKKGYAQAKKFSWKRMAEQTLAVYEKALKK